MYLSSQPHLGKDVCSAVWIPQASIWQCNCLLSQFVFYKTWVIDIKAENLAYLCIIFMF